MHAFVLAPGYWNVCVCVLLVYAWVRESLCAAYKLQAFRLVLVLITTVIDWQCNNVAAILFFLTPLLLFLLLFLHQQACPPLS